VAVAGIGVDVVDVDRFAAALTRTPGLLRRVLTDDEIAGRHVAGHAARFAAKEALAKALGAPRGLRWHDAQVHTRRSGQPHIVATGTVASALQESAVHAVHLSLTHDAGVAVAMVVLES
jgi:holo-[acyl-carrier protein] synthase